MAKKKRAKAGQPSQSPDPAELANPHDRLSGVDLIRAILGNIHDSLKWCFQVVMALALVKAIETFAPQIAGEDINTPRALIGNLFSISSLVFVSFVLIFIRFYFGDSRHMDLSYEETHFYHGMEDELGKFSGRKRAIDILSMLFNGINFYFMAIFIDKPAMFLSFYVLTLVANVFWLLVNVINHYSKATIPELLIGNTKRYYPLLVWSINNVVFLAAIAVILESGVAYGVLICVVLSIANSIVDFSLTWQFYFPPLQQIYNESNAIESV